MPKVTRKSLRVRLVAVGLILVCFGMFVYGVRRGAYVATSDGAIYTDPDRYDGRVLLQYRFDQMEREFAEKIPADSRIRLVEPSAEGSIWTMMLTEFAAINGIRIAEPAEVGVAVVEDGSGEWGVRLVVEPLG
jgi:hypothetical protein